MVGSRSLTREEGEEEMTETLCTYMDGDFCFLHTFIEMSLVNLNNPGRCFGVCFQTQGLQSRKEGGLFLKLVAGTGGRFALCGMWQW